MSEDTVLQEATSKLSLMLDIPLLDMGKGPVTPGMLLTAVLILASAFAISYLLRRNIQRINQGRYSLSPSSVYTLERLSHYSVLILGVVLALSTAGLDFGKLALVASALSVGIGFGLQAIVSNFVSGLILLLERSLKIGDFIELQDGVAGVVSEIRVRATIITTAENSEIIVPNSEFVNGRVKNWTHSNHYCRLRVPFGVAYGTDIEPMRQLVVDTALAQPHTLADTEERQPQVWMRGFGDSSLDFELMVWTTPEFAARPGAARSQYLTSIDAAFREAGITIPFPQRDLHMRN